MENDRLLNELADGGIEVLRDPGPFNYSALHNRALGSLRGPLLCLLNNDIEIIDEGWLAILAPHALRADVGAVHAHRREAEDVQGSFDRARLP